LFDTVYFRDIRDLTLHGGFDLNGELIALPVFSGLGVKGIKAGNYVRQSETLWESEAFRRVLKEIDAETVFSRPVGYWMRYPELTSSLPLPAAAVIDHVLEGEDNENISLEVAENQIARCAAFPRWRMFNNLGAPLAQNRKTIEKFLAAENRFTGVFTPAFLGVLQAIQNLHTAIDEAEEAGRFVVLSQIELTFINHFDSAGETFRRSDSIPGGWGSYFKILKARSSVVRSAIADPKLRMDATGKISRYIEEDRLRWSVVPDIGAETLISFAHALRRAQGRGAICSESEKKAFEKQRNPGENTVLMAMGRGQEFASTVHFAWKTLLERAADRPFDKAVPLPLTAIASAWSRRFDANSVFSTLDILGNLSRPVSEGGVLILRSEVPQNAENLDGETHPSFIKIEPAIPLPQVAAIPPKQRNKKFPSVIRRYVSLPTWEKEASNYSDSVNTSRYTDEVEQIIWPHGHLWQAVDLVKTLISFPELFLCPEALVHGQLKVSYEQWEKYDLKPGTVEKNDSGVPWMHCYEWFLGVYPWAIAPQHSRKISAYDDRHLTEWPVQIVDGGISSSDVRLVTEFVPNSDQFSSKNFVSITHLIREFAKVAGERTIPLSELLSQFGKDLTFQARQSFEVEGKPIEEADWFSAVKTKAGYYRLRNGLTIDDASYTSKTDQFILRKRVYAKFQNLHLSDLWTVQRTALGQSSAQLPPEEYVRQLAIRISPVLDQLDSQALPALSKTLLNGELTDLDLVLRHYQKSGLAWIYLRFNLGLGVCLADEMGLGKTLQAIALLRAMKDPQKPSLVVMPKTLLYNWQREIEKFGGGLRVAICGEDLLTSDADVFLITYPRLRLNAKELSEKPWNVVVLDEAQAIKNSETLVTAAAGQLKASHRLALSGTPVENHAGELWSIIHWLNPGYLGEQGDFSAYTALARSSERKDLLLAPLRESLAPVILRRTKSDPDVALGLPDKIFQDISYDLSDEQRGLYESVIEAVLSEESLGASGFQRSALFLKAILHLKQICIHPELFYGEQDEDQILSHIDAKTKKTTRKIRARVLQRLKTLSQSNDLEQWLSRSGKLAAVRELVQSLNEQSRGILIFTQYLGAANLLQRTLKPSGVESIPFIHGGLSSDARMEIVDEFNENCRLLRSADSPCPILILSLKAGGTGLNLTGADRVIHLDRWWNPAVEDQATDRAHRIGQARTVFIHTTTCAGTIEESIARIFIDKRRLAEDLLGNATSEAMSDLLQNREGFLNLVDPQRLFSQRLIKTENRPGRERGTPDVQGN
jgi:SNF2 family DNA or RNA helicase